MRLVKTHRGQGEKPSLKVNQDNHEFTMNAENKLLRKLPNMKEADSKVEVPVPSLPQPSAYSNKRQERDFFI